ncbi:hypothetical protein PV755_46505 [Streptomyces caniscabiei]|uniref:Uncharacterized protein n=1 Tax=Streptomyces caniscabiei TaxID=2746961 RepID=A0A927L145_9ACTN|nr:hypothetical protein [Streptomyces caniscabiei]MBD9723487.1 hypothetical protein [Streptomyces caniscabiei]MDX3516257.1 hypothetical protein [Streptomyces caniscabiei]MDX3725286.1 hypothetical protein [Streptomyces caniscabiei]WEO27057.1 hypothetical protein IHE65_30020 [Streptomyces caniscabiei]
MNDHPVHRDDIAALRKEDDLKAYMRSLLRPTQKTGTPPKRKPKRTWGAIPIPADHKPGQWPPGTSPPGPAPERHLPPETWQQAVNDYRAEAQAAEQEPTP